MGAWYGNFYSDNPKYLAEYLLQNTDYRIFWIGNSQMADNLPKHANLQFVLKGSLRAYWILLRAKFWFCCTGRGVDLTGLPIHGGATCVNLWHGTPSGKRSDHNTVWDKNSPLGRGIRGALERAYALMLSGQRDWLTVANDTEAETLTIGFPCAFSTDKALKIGTPRYDFLIHNATNTSLICALKEKYARILKFDPARKIITYMPTWRSAGGKIFCFYVNIFILNMFLQLSCPTKPYRLCVKAVSLWMYSADIPESTTMESRFLSERSLRAVQFIG